MMKGPGAVFILDPLARPRVCRATEQDCNGTHVFQQGPRLLTALSWLQ